MRARTITGYKSAWCGFPDEVAGINGHHRCRSKVCTCHCHGINAVLNKKETR